MCLVELYVFCDFQNWLWQQAGRTVEFPMTDVFPFPLPYQPRHPR